MPFSKIVAIKDENGNHLIEEIPILSPMAVVEGNEREIGNIYGVNDIEGKEVLLLTGIELCEHYEKLRLLYLDLHRRYTLEGVFRLGDLSKND